MADGPPWPHCIESRNRTTHKLQRLLVDALFGVITGVVVLVRAMIDPRRPTCAQVTIMLAFTLTKPIQPLNVFFVVAIVMISLPQLVLVRGTLYGHVRDGRR